MNLETASLNNDPQIKSKTNKYIMSLIFISVQNSKKLLVISPVLVVMRE